MTVAGDLTEFLIKGIIIGLLVSVPMGPVGVLCVQRTLNRGKRSGFVSGLGAAAADAIFALIAGFGLTIIINFIEQKHAYFQIMGGLFVLYLGIRIFYTNPARQLKLQRLGKSQLSQDFGSVFLITLSNPIAIFLFLAMMAATKVAGARLRILDITLLTAGIAMGAVFWWFVLVSITNRFRRRIRLRNIWWLNKITGSVVALFGIMVLISVWIIK